MEKFDNKTKRKIIFRTILYINFPTRIIKSFLASSKVYEKLSAS